MEDRECIIAKYLPKNKIIVKEGDFDEDEQLVFAFKPKKVDIRAKKR